MLHSDPTLAVRDFANYQQQKRQRWTKTMQEQYLRNVEHLAHIAGGTFAIAGVLKQDLPQVGDMADLMVHILDDLEKIAQCKSGVPQMLYDKWCREYKVIPPSKLMFLKSVAA